MTKPDAKISAKKSSTETVRATRLHVVPHAEGWAVRERAQTKPTDVFRTQNEAVEAAQRAGGKDAQIIVHTPDGRMTYTLSNAPADEMMFDYWRSLHADPSTAKGQRTTRKAS